ncbi:hypothetical protein DUNSADRAFT_3024, partial [Dunaliella salina]
MGACFTEVLRKLGASKADEGNVIVYVGEYSQGEAQERRMPPSRSFPVFRPFLLSMLDFVHQANGDVSAVCNEMKKANRMVGQLTDDTE